MRRWFQGTFEGHYVGTRTAPARAARGTEGEHFRFQIYQALVRDVQLLADAPEPIPAMDAPNANATSATPEEPALTAERPAAFHHTPAGPALHQDQIAQVHFLDAHGPGRTVRGAAFDVLASDLHFSHKARHQGRAYGRVTGTLSGWYRPPPAPPIPEEVAPPPPRAVVWSSDEVPTASVEELGRRAEGLADSLAASQHVTGDREQASPRPSLQRSVTAPGAPSQGMSSGFAARSTDAPLPTLPFFTIATFVAAVLLLVATPASAGIWCLCVLPPLLVRKWLLVVIPDAPAVNLFAYVLAGVQLVLVAFLIATWQQDGCRALTLGSLLVVVGNVVLTAFSPRPYPFALSLLGFAALLIDYYGPFGLPFCG